MVSIKNMDMPSCCKKCELQHYDMASGRRKCDKTKTTISYNEDKRPHWCPLVEVKQEEDCVSRQAVDELCFKFLKSNTDNNVAFYEHFRDLPPVLPAHDKILEKQVSKVLDRESELTERLNELRMEVQSNYRKTEEKYLNRIKEAKEEIENEIKFFDVPSILDTQKVQAICVKRAKIGSYKHALEILDKITVECEE